MMEKKQVDKSHYAFESYVPKQRWASLWHQLDEVIRLKPRNVLEIGPGPGVFKANATLFNINVETLDIDPELAPNHVGSVKDIPLHDDSYDVVCAFQVLEHLPYADSLLAFKEMTRVSRKHIVLSLPNSKWVYRVQVDLPKLGLKTIHIPNPFQRVKEWRFNGEHHWELEAKDFETGKFVADLEPIARLKRTYRVEDNPYHQFFIFCKTQR